MSRETAFAKVGDVQLARTKGDGNDGGSGGVRVDDQAATDTVDAVKTTTTTTTTSVSAQSFDSIQEDEATTPSGRPVGLRLAESGEDDARRPRTGTSSGDSKSVAQRGSSISVAGPAVCSGPAPASPKLSKGGHAPALPVVADSLAHPSPQEEGPQSQTGLIFERFTVWLTESRVYIVASTARRSDTRHRILKIDRHYTPADATHELNVVEDAVVYSNQELADLKKMIGDGNRTTGGLTQLRDPYWGIVGFTRFTVGWYLVLIKDRAQKALLGGHYLYQCTKSEMIYISNAGKTTGAEELKLRSIFEAVDLSKDFYFSYTYDITNTLQTNLTRPPRPQNAAEVATQPQTVYRADHAFHEPHTETAGAPVSTSDKLHAAWGFNDKFVWNHHLLEAAFSDTMHDIPESRERSCWILPLIYGFLEHAKVSVYGRPIYLTVIGRRSRYFAGARFLRRGVNDEGHVANEVETEQIICDAYTTSFFQPAPATPGRAEERVPSSRYSSFVQHRGSIPLSWQQDINTGTLGKPPINLHLVDPYHSAAALHFDDLFARYGSPIICYNLVKEKESEARESKLTGPYVQCLDYLNQFLPEKDHILYMHFDVHKAAKNKKKKAFLGEALDKAQMVVDMLGFFHAGPEASRIPKHEHLDLPPRRTLPRLQRGIARTNCIDCVDRTNAVQATIAEVAFGNQLYAMGIIEDPRFVGPFTDASTLLMNMFDRHGDTIAFQYGGSALIHTSDTYLKGNQWQSQGRDKLEGVKRFYANLALDTDKQASIDLFLGITSASGQTHLPTVVAGTRASSPAPVLASKVGPGTLVPTPSGASTAASLSVGPYAGTTLGVERLADNKGSESFDDPDDQQPMGAPLRIARRDYRQWYSKEYLENEMTEEEAMATMKEAAKRDIDYWAEYYRPLEYTHIDKQFAYQIKSSHNMLPRLHFNHRLSGPELQELSPFVKRLEYRAKDEAEQPEEDEVLRGQQRERRDSLRRSIETSQRTMGYSLASSDAGRSPEPRKSGSPKPVPAVARVTTSSQVSTRLHDGAMGLLNRLHPGGKRGREPAKAHAGPSSAKSAHPGMSSPAHSASASERGTSGGGREPNGPRTADLPPASTTEGLALRLLDPRVADSEAAEYASYVDQFRNLNLSNELSYESSADDLRVYRQAVDLASDGGQSQSRLFRVDKAAVDVYEKHVQTAKEVKVLRSSDRDYHRHQPHHGHGGHHNQQHRAHASQHAQQHGHRQAHSGAHAQLMSRHADSPRARQRQLDEEDESSDGTSDASSQF